MLHLGVIVFNVFWGCVDPWFWCFTSITAILLRNVSGLQKWGNIFPDIVFLKDLSIKNAVFAKTLKSLTSTFYHPSHAKPLKTMDSPEWQTSKTQHFWDIRGAPRAILGQILKVILFGAHFEPHLGAHFGPFWDRFKTVLDSFWDRFGIVSGLFFGYFFNFVSDDTAADLKDPPRLLSSWGVVEGAPQARPKTTSDYRKSARLQVACVNMRLKGLPC